ncbi:MAG: ATP-binding cassette domain-containing protein [Chlamydiia bacterium]
MTSSPLLSVKNIKKTFRHNDHNIRAVDGVSLDVFQDRTLGLVGESGSGKSTLARLILRLEKPDEGEIFFQGVDLLKLSRKEMMDVRMELQIIFQDPFGSLNPRMTAQEVIMEPLEIFMKKLPFNEKRQRVLHLMELVGLDPNFAHRLPHEFSGGQRQRIAIARALALHPRLIICDEPIAALDVSIQSQIINLLKRLKSELGLNYLFISHDLAMVKYLCDDLAVMHFGKIVEQGDSDLIYENPTHTYTKTLLNSHPKLIQT